MSSIYRILITDFGSLKKQIRKEEDGILLPVIPRVGDIIVYFYQVHPEVDDTKEIDLKVISVKILCQPGLDNFNIEPGQESKFWDKAFTYHAEIEVDEVEAEQ